MFTYYILVSD